MAPTPPTGSQKLEDTGPGLAGPPAPEPAAPEPAASEAPGFSTGALPKTPPVDPAELILITNPDLPGGAVTTVPRRAYDDLWQERGYVIVGDDADVVAAETGQLFLKEEAVGKYQQVTQDGIRNATADIANNTTTTPGPTLPGSRA